MAKNTGVVRVDPELYRELEEYHREFGKWAIKELIDEGLRMFVEDVLRPRAEAIREQRKRMRKYQNDTWAS